MIKSALATFIKKIRTLLSFFADFFHWNTAPLNYTINKSFALEYFQKISTFHNFPIYPTQRPIDRPDTEFFLYLLKDQKVIRSPIESVAI